MAVHTYRYQLLNAMPISGISGVTLLQAFPVLQDFSFDSSLLAQVDDALKLQGYERIATDPAQGIPGGTQTVVTTAQFDTSSTNLADITGFTGFTLLANKNYFLRCVMPVVTAVSTTGLQFGIHLPAPAALTAMSVDMYGQVSATTVIHSVCEGVLDTKIGPASGAGASPGPSNPSGRRYVLEGPLRMGATGGTLSVQACSGVNASQVSILANASLVLTQLN